MAREPQPRKPLRQRVAERKRGIKEFRPVSARKKRIFRLLKFFLLGSQYTGLLLLLISLGGIVTNNFQIENANLIIIYSSMFLIGRFGIMVVKSIAAFK